MPRSSSTAVGPPRPSSSKTLVKEEDILLCFGLYCCNAGLYSKNYVGCASELTACCLEAVCCLKAGEDPIWCSIGGGPGKCCRFGLGLLSLGVVYPRACCVLDSQICCLGCSGIVPPDDEFPRTVACFGLMCEPTCGLFPRLSDVQRGSRPASSGQRPDEEGLEATQRQQPQGDDSGLV